MPNFNSSTSKKLNHLQNIHLASLRQNHPDIHTQAQKFIHQTFIPLHTYVQYLLTE